MNVEEEQRLSEIRERLDKAPRGSWAARQCRDDDTGCLSEVWLVEFREWKDVHDLIDVDSTMLSKEAAEFIAHSKSDIEWLLERMGERNDGPRT